MKQMKSYRFEEQEIFEMKDISDDLGLTETDLIMLMKTAFEEFGIGDAIANKLDNCSSDEWSRYAGIVGLQKLIRKAAKDNEIQNEIRAKIWMTL